MGVYCSLWLLRSISSTSRSYDTKLLESNIREKSLLQNMLHSVYPTCSYLMRQMIVVNTCCASVCKSKLAFSRDPTSSQPKSLDYLVPV